MSAIQSGRASGMIPLERQLAEMVGDGRLALEDAAASANDLDTLKTYLRR